MKQADLTLLPRMLKQPTSMADLSTTEWENLIRMARVADVTARLAMGAKAAGVWDHIPNGPRRHLHSAQLLVARQHRELAFEVNEIDITLRDLQIPVVLLKGAAYVAKGLQAASGRFVSDVDVLVPHHALSQVEAALMMGSWMSSAKSEYDQRYYRTWMHELPPMQHIKRGTVIDVHHAIMPLSSRVHPSSILLLQDAKPLKHGSCLFTLQPIDMVLHSATHLMHEGNFEQGFRGLVDLDALITEFTVNPTFWVDLVPRAKALELQRPLFYALRYAQQVMGTGVPHQVSAALASTTGALPGGLSLKWMDAMFSRVLRAPHPLVADTLTPFARQFMYLRGHWLRMPPGLLLRHLTRKLFIKSSKDE